MQKMCKKHAKKNDVNDEKPGVIPRNFECKTNFKLARFHCFFYKASYESKTIMLFLTFYATNKFNKYPDPSPAFRSKNSKQN